jgi:acetyltransferase-like isoleucine patch superfamily enzyme
MAANDVNPQRLGVFIHPSADVSDQASVGPGTRIWQQAQVRDGARIGSECILGKGVFIDLDVRVGDRCKLENGAFVFRGMNLEDGVFIGPGVMLLNDRLPRAINSDGSLKSDGDWTVSYGLVKRGASIGGGALVLPGVTIGSFALVGSGAVVTRDVPEHGIAYGNPAALRGFACDCGQPSGRGESRNGSMILHCESCGLRTVIPLAIYAELERHP